MVLVLGTDGNNVLVGSVGNDQILGFGGNDSLYGGLGNDLLEGGTGNDLLADDEGGRDQLFGQEGDDYLQSRDLSGDVIDGGEGRDRAYVERNTTAAIYADFSEVSGQGSVGPINVGTATTVLNDIERVNLYLGSGNDRANIVVSSTRFGSGDFSQVGFGAGTDVLRISLADFGSAITMSAVPFTPGSNVRFLWGEQEVFSALSVERVNVTGSSAGDQLYGLSLNDTLYGGSGSDTLTGGDGRDRLFGGSDNDILSGLSGNDLLIGGHGNDALAGDAGHDRLSGGRGVDTLFGGSGRDAFVFDSTRGSSNADVIDDFSAIDDVIHLWSERFAGLATGTLAQGAFVANLSGQAATASQRIIYETDTGRVFHDPDGVGGSARALFATLAPGLTLTAEDFFVF